VRIVCFEKLHVAEHVTKHMSIIEDRQSIFYEGTRCFLLAVLCFSSVSRFERAILKRQGRRPQLKNWDWNPGLTLVQNKNHFRRIFLDRHPYFTESRGIRSKAIVQHIALFYLGFLLCCNSISFLLD